MGGMKRKDSTTQIHTLAPHLLHYNCIRDGSSHEVAHVDLKCGRRM
jgi:hypothetical protein